MAKWEEKLAKIGASLDELSEKANAAAEDAKAARELQKEVVQDKIGTAKGDVAALQEKARIAEEENKSKISSALLKAQMTLRAKAEDRKEARDKKFLENYINDNIDYIFDCYDAAVMLVANAQLAILETLDAAAEYEARFGEPVEETEEKKEE